MGAFGVNFGQHSLDDQALAFVVAALDVETEVEITCMLLLGTNRNKETSPGL